VICILIGVATRGKALSLLQTKSKKRHGGPNFGEDQTDANTTVNLGDNGGDKRIKQGNIFQAIVIDKDAPLFDNTKE
jgi:hypothetical protein